MDVPQQSYNYNKESKSGAEGITGRVVTPKNSKNNISALGG